jgi:hypothetical protein
MQGHFSKLSLEQADQMLSFLDFTRCVRPDGSAYGTGGTCRKGKKKEKEKSEVAPRPRLDRGSYLAGNQVDSYFLDRKARNWRFFAGLKEGNSDAQEHDRVHVLFHEFIGGEDKIGKWLGTGQKSPTVAEELFVGLLHEAAYAKGKEKGYVLSDKELETRISQDILSLNSLNLINRNDYRVYQLYMDRAGKPKAGAFI